MAQKMVQFDVWGTLKQSIFFKKKNFFSFFLPAICVAHHHVAAAEVIPWRLVVVVVGGLLQRAEGTLIGGGGEQRAVLALVGHGGWEGRRYVGRRRNDAGWRHVALLEQRRRVGRDGRGGGAARGRGRRARAVVGAGGEPGQTELVEDGRDAAAAAASMVAVGGGREGGGDVNYIIPSKFESELLLEFMVLGTEEESHSDMIVITRKMIQDQQRNNS